MYQYGLTGCVLLFCTWTDIRHRRIYRSVIAAHLVLALSGHLIVGDRAAVSVLIGMVPGLICLMLSAATRQALGYGDAFLILSCGFSLGIESMLAALLTAFLCVSIWAIGLVCTRRGNRKTEIPFAPFLLAGAVLQGLGVLSG